MNIVSSVRKRIANRSGAILVGPVPLGVTCCACALLTLLAVAGCGSKGPARSSIHGTVTLDGKAVPQGSIAFVPSGATKGHAAGGQIVDGAYSISRADGPVAGSHRVEIRASRKTGKKIPAGSPMPPGTMVEEEVQAIPTHYNNESKLSQEIKPGDNTFNFDLKSH